MLSLSIFKEDDLEMSTEDREPKSRTSEEYIADRKKTVDAANAKAKAVKKEE